MRVPAQTIINGQEVTPRYTKVIPHYPDYHLFPKTWQELIPPPSTTQHPDGPYNSSRSKKELKEVVCELKRQLMISSGTERVLLVLIDVEFHKGQINITNDEIAKRARISVKVVEKVLKRLEEGGIIQRLHYMPTPTSYRRQMIICWDSLMIPHTLKKRDNLILNSVFSSSSLMDLKDTKYPTGACASHKPLASTEPEVPCSPIFPDSIQGENVKEESLPDSYKSQVSRIIEKPLELERSSPAVHKSPIGLLKKQEINMSIFGNIVSKEELARIEAEKNKERYARIEKQQARQKEDSHAFTKIEARKERLQNIQTLYPAWREVCEQEGCSLNELKQRMWQNFDYEPFDEDTSNFNPFCHPRYGFMSEEEKDKEFIRAVNEWIYPAPYRHSGRNLALFKRARLRADCLKCLYTDWIVSIYYGVGERKMRYTHINSKYGEQYYSRWLRQDKPMPRKSGESQENIVRMSRLRQWKNSKPGYKRKDSYELLSERVDPIIRSFAAEYAATRSKLRATI
jgi:ribosomal protein S25